MIETQTKPETLLQQTQARFDALPEVEWSDDQCREADFLLRVTLETTYLRMEKDYLYSLVERMANAIDTGDKDAARNAVLWARHYRKLHPNA